MTEFTPHAWFWIVGGDTSRAWSSAIGGYVSEYETSRLSRIASESELNDVLRAYGLPLPVPAQDDYTSAIQSVIDAAARSRNYTDGVSLASYVASTVPGWAAEAQAFVAWRDAVWFYVYNELAKVLTGQRAQPSIAELISELPAIVWPD